MVNDREDKILTAIANVHEDVNLLKLEVRTFQAVQEQRDVTATQQRLEHEVILRDTKTGLCARVQSLEEKMGLLCKTTAALLAALISAIGVKLGSLLGK